MAPTTERDFALLPPDKQRVYRMLQAVHLHGSPDGPWFFLVAQSVPRQRAVRLIGVTDTSMLRPQVFALRQGSVDIGVAASEKQAIDALLESVSKQDGRSGAGPTGTGTPAEAATPTAARSCSPWPRAVGRGFGAPTSSDAASRPTPGNVPWGTAPGPPSRPRPAHPAPGSPLPHRADEAQRPVVTLRRLLGRGRGRRPARALARTRVCGRRAASRGPEPTCTDRPGTTSPPASTGRRSWCTARLKTRWPRS